MTKTKSKASFASRTRNIYRHQTIRFGRLPYTLEEFRARAKLAETCPYCGGPITTKNLSTDHAIPIARGGSAAIANLVFCDLRCNKIKGKLSDCEFLRLTALLAQFPPEVGKDVLARLYAGGRFMRRR